LGENVDDEMDGNRGPVEGNSSNDYDVATIDELSAKFSVQGTSSSKSTGKKKVVSKLIFSF